MMKNQTKVLAFSFTNYLQFLKILPVTRFKDPKAAILSFKLLTGSRL
jgi:hypothetical protein